MIDKSRKRVAIVSGVGPGLGAALVRKLAQEGCRVGMFARSAGLIRKLATQLGSQVMAIPTDISDAKQVAAGFRKVREKLGPVEILIAHARVHSAGTWKRHPRRNSSVLGVGPSSARSCAPAKPCPTC